MERYQAGFIILQSSGTISLEQQDIKLANLNFAINIHLVLFNL